MDRATRPWYFWPLIAFVVGLLIGWLGIGWGVWPIDWKNALPQDLAPEYQQAYLAMVADEYASNGDLRLAQQRLAGWPQDQLANALSNAQENLSTTDPARAGNVQLLASALSVSLGSGNAPVPTPAPAEGTAGTTLARICTAFLWVILVLAAILFFAYLFLRWRSAHDGTPPPDVAGWFRARFGHAPRLQGVERADYAEYEREETGREGLAERTAQEIAAQEKARWDDTAPLNWREVSAPATTSPTLPEDRPGALFNEERGEVDEADLPPFMSPRTDPRAEGAARPTGAEPSATPPSGGRVVFAGGPGSKVGPKIGDFVAVYQMGEPDYDEAFDINDPIDGLVGQCGLQLNEPVGRNRDQAVALQAWLWDSSDPDTRVKVLMSEAAYRDTATRAQHVGEHEALPVRQGTEFELESHDLLLRGRVERVEYAEQEANRAVFADLQVRMQVYRKS